MPSDTGGSSSFLSQDLPLHPPHPNERQIGFWKNTATPATPDGVKEYALGDTSSAHPHMLKRFDVPDNALRRQPLFDNHNTATTTNNNNNFDNKSSYLASANKFNVMAGRGGGAADHYENGLFSSSLSDLFTRKLRLNNNAMYGHSVGAAAASQYQEEEEPFQSLEEIEAQTIGNLLPDDDDLLSGVTDGLDCKVQPGGSADDAEELDFFSSVGGMEMGEDGVAATQLGGEHPHGEHPSRTLFVRNINSNVEDSELRILFEQYGDIRTLYTACKHRGFVMISYYDIRAARRAMHALQNKPLRRRKLDIHYSIPKDNPSDKDINQGTVMIYNIDSTVSSDELRHIFGVYGEVKEIRETPQGSRHKSIEFYDIRAAEAASRELNKSELGGKQMRIESTHPGGSKRLNSPFPELDADEASALLQMCSPSTDFTTPGSMDHRSLLGVTTAPGSQLLDAELQHGIQANSFSSIIGVESGGMPSSLQNQLRFNDFRSTPNYHPSSLPEYQDGLTNSILSNSPSNLAARMSERLGNRQFNRIGGSIGRSIELNDNAFGHSGNGNGSPVNHHYMWNHSHHQPQPHNMMWPNSPSLMNGVSNAHSLPRGPSHMANTFMHINNHHVGSAPSVNPSIWDRRQSYAGESPDTSVFHPGSLGNMRVPGNSPHPLDFVSHNIFPRMGDLPIPSKNIGLASHHQNSVMFPSRGQMIPMMTSFDSPSDRTRNRRNEATANQSDNKKQFELDLDRIMRGDDRRTTLMIKNIPNKYTSKMLLAAIDERHRGTYDFIYLPIDFKNKCNVGYAFINMTEPPLIVPFFQAFNGKKWEKFNSEKVASLAYARIQGKAALIAHFQNSSLMNEDKRCRPILFHTDGPNAGDQVPFPMGVNVRSRVSKNRNNSNEENHGESSLDVGNGEGSSNGDSSSGSTKDFE
ncbi:protein MEI2-like 4 [Artemisia annua]|uniref:Protein MEI2-like 4 n=1 Tax=Artemisia annua TaxID=35608 RepID=A0A2U1PRV8_ARTAN|nr:protein MEI2-like 4 [Artemisia annua]